MYVFITRRDGNQWERSTTIRTIKMIEVDVLMKSSIRHDDDPAHALWHGTLNVTSCVYEMQYMYDERPDWMSEARDSQSVVAFKMQPACKFVRSPV